MAKKEEKAVRKGPEFIVHVDLKGDLPDFQIGYGEGWDREAAEEIAKEMVEAGSVESKKDDRTFFYPAHEVRLITVRASDIVTPVPAAKVKR